MKDLRVETRAGITTICYAAIINATPGKIWDVLKQPGRICDFHPLIKKSYMDSSSSPSGKGGIRNCHLIPMGIMREKITEWNEGHGFTTEVIGGRMLPPYIFMKGVVKIEANENNSRASFTFTYKLKYGIIGDMMNSLFIRPQFKNAPYQYITGLKNHIESIQ